ncbi:hypothetical protein CBL_05706 [Carabus blaptoides fortunei]
MTATKLAANVRCTFRGRHKALTTRCPPRGARFLYRGPTGLTCCPNPVSSRALTSAFSLQTHKHTAATTSMLSTFICFTQNHRPMKHFEQCSRSLTKQAVGPAVTEVKKYKPVRLVIVNNERWRGQPQNISTKPLRR